MRVWVAVCVIAVALAGCSEGSAQEKDEIQVKDVEAPKGSLGSISGVVVTEDIKPINGAKVVLANSGRETLSNEQGQFVFEDLDAGVYFLRVSHTDFQEVQSSVDVQASKVSKPRILLPREATVEPYQITHQIEAAHVFSTPALVLYYVTPDTGIDAPFTHMVYEADWSQSTLIFDPLEEKPIRYWLDIGPWHRDGRMAEVDVLHFNNTDSDGKANVLEIRSYPSSLTMFSVDARATLFVTLFYNQVPPEDWSILMGTGQA